jgi:hypothetical protein
MLWKTMKDQQLVVVIIFHLAFSAVNFGYKLTKFILYCHWFIWLVNYFYLRNVNQISKKNT